ncbi:MAG TPA: Mur ligase domain-containing protein, partial [Candidatus Paceibacterota bacterium]|nr:Mur ligase domain-containing protein [Candidatus Paceibacterota bacterium]
MNQNPANQNDYYDAKLRSLTDVEARLHPRNTTVPENPKHIHISGVCGTAMGALAGLLKEKYGNVENGSGVKITGSDKACYAPMSTVLADLGIVSEPFSKEHIEKADVVIVGNSIWPMNEEAEAVRELNKPAISLPEALQSFFIKGKKSLVVTGTHGKTTTSGLL